MGKEYVFMPDEAVILKETDVAHGSGGYGDELVLTNLNIICTHRGMFGGIKDVFLYPLSQVKEYNGKPQIIQGKTPNGEPCLEIYFKYGGVESFRFRSWNKITIDRWVKAAGKLFNNNAAKEENDPGRSDPFKSIAKKLSEKAVGVTGSIKNTFNQKKDEFIAKREEKKAADLEKIRQEKRMTITPLFSDEVKDKRWIRIVDHDVRLDEEWYSDYEGNVGFSELTQGGKVPTLYTRFVDRFGFVFLPYLSESVFIKDPCVPDKYIEIDEYFNYMKQVRVNELTLIAQSLGAKHVEIRLCTDNTESLSSHMDGNASVGFGAVISAKLNAVKNEASKSSSSFELWASTDFDTNSQVTEPVLPEVIYFRNESDIDTLIQMAMSKNKLTKRTYKMKVSSSSGMSVSEAASISAAVKGVGLKGGATFDRSAKAQRNATLEYTIEF